MGPPISYLTTALFWGGVLATFPLIHRLLRRRYPTKALLFMGHVAVLCALFFVLRFIASQVSRAPQLARLQNPVGNCNPLLGPLMQSALGTALLSQVTLRLHPLAQYVYYAGEDFCRAHRLGIMMDSPAASVCREVVKSGDKYECFKEVLGKMAPFSKPALWMHMNTVSRVLKVKAEDNDPARDPGMMANAESSIKLAEFVLYLNQLRKIPGGPDEILEKISAKDRQKIMGYLEKFSVGTVTQVPTVPEYLPKFENQ